MLRARSSPQSRKSPSALKPSKTVRFHPYVWNGVGLASDPKFRSGAIVSLERFPWDMTSDPKVSSRAFVCLERFAESIAAERSVPYASPEVIREKRNARESFVNRLSSSSDDDGPRAIWRSPLVVTPTNATGYRGFAEHDSDSFANSSINADIPGILSSARQKDVKESPKSTESPHTSKGSLHSAQGSLGTFEASLPGPSKPPLAPSAPHAKDRLAGQADTEGLALCEGCLDDEGQGYPCVGCGKAFVTKALLASHLRANPACRPFECTVCLRRYTHQSYLKIHSRIHSETSAHHCTVCQMTFPTNDGLRNHMVTHNKQSQHMCEICNYAASCASALTTHLRVHSKEKPFKCHICPSAFARKSQLTRHLIIHRNETPFSCSFCSYAANTKCALDAHIVRHHTKEFHFECEICPKKFATKLELTEHAATHQKEKNYLCQFCPTAYKHKASLFTHQNTKHPAEMEKLRAEMAAQKAKQSAGGGYVCEICGKVYKELGQCGNHGVLLRIPVKMEVD